MVNSIAIGNYIKEKRTLKGWSQEKLAEEVGVSTKTVSIWETGKFDSIKNDNLDRLSVALNVSIAEIYSGRDLDELDMISKETLSAQIRELNEKYSGMQEITSKVEDRGVTALDVSVWSFGLSCFAVAMSTWAISPNLFNKILSLLLIAFGIWFLLKGKQAIRTIENRIRQERERSNKQ